MSIAAASRLPGLGAAVAGLCLTALLALPAPAQDAPPAQPTAETPTETPARTPADTPAEAPAATPPVVRPLSPQVTLTVDSLRRDPRLNRYVSDIRPDPAAADLPVRDPTVNTPELFNLRRWMAEGTAAGLAGVFYDNRDGGHSPIWRHEWPQLTQIVYPPELRRQGQDKALAEVFLFRAPTIGNASMAITGELARSLPRYAMTRATGAMAAFVGYVTNHLYVYPAHLDISGRVDRFPAILPYFIVSLGSSGSDKPFLDALLLTLASFRPETRARLEAEGLIAPTLVMLLRRGLAQASDYLAPAAHPSHFESSRLRPAVMQAAAHAMTPDSIPPLVRLTVLGEDFAPSAGLTGESERLFDTPSAIARLWRGWAAQRQMVVSAAATSDPNGRPLRFHWILISGDPAKVRIEPLDEAQSRARILIDWHDPPIPPAPGAYPSPRIEIAVIADNGAHYSAPGFVTVALPIHERRDYAPGPDGRMRLVSVDYDAKARGEAYDPVLWWSAPWRDEAIHDPALGFLGWRRHLAEGPVMVTAAAPGVLSRAATGPSERLLEWRPAP